MYEKLKKIAGKLKNGEDLTLDFVGDSVTHGLNHCSSDETYTAVFASLMAEHFKEYSVFRYDGIPTGALAPMGSFAGPFPVSVGNGRGRMDIIRNGIGGNTVARAYNRIADFAGTAANGKIPDITFMMFGINDALKPDPAKYVTADVFKQNYGKLLDEVIHRIPDTCVILLTATTNDWTVDEHCQKTVELAAERGIPLIDTHRLWEEHYDAGAGNFGHGDWLAGGSDACHPTPVGAKATAKFIFDEFLKVFSYE